MMVWAEASVSNFVWEDVARSSLFYKQICAFWFVKIKAVNFSFQDYFDNPYVTQF